MTTLKEDATFAVKLAALRETERQMSFLLGIYRHAQADRWPELKDMAGALANEVDANRNRLNSEILALHAKGSQ